MHSSELASRRRHLKISQAELGARLGLSSNTIARWERGDRPITHGKLLKLALEQLTREIEEEHRPRAHRHPRSAAEEKTNLPSEDSEGRR